MAKIEITSAESNSCPAMTERIEVRFWGLGGRADQNFFIGGGINFNAEANVWMEILYTVQGAQIFYTRTFLHAIDDFDAEAREAWLDEVIATGEGRFGFGDMLPESGMLLKLEKRSYDDDDGKPVEYSSCELEIDADVGAVFGNSPPGQRFIKIALRPDEVEEAAQFMRELIHDLDDAYQGKHPNPALLPQGSSEWNFVRRLNQHAYNAISNDYQEKYFDNPLLTEAFARWLAQLPAGGSVLDAGCGHGSPVIGRLLENDMQVTGTDFSPAMLKRAREQFPQAQFFNMMTPEIDFEGEFDGVCSFSSTLYLDPIDLFHSIYRLHCALKPGGLLFLYGYDLHPGWRGIPYDTVMKQWMWSWTYSMEEAASAVEEHGFFEVLSADKVMTEEEREEMRARLEKQMAEDHKKAEEMAAAMKAENTSAESAQVEIEEPPDLRSEPQVEPAPIDGEEDTPAEIPEFDFSSIPVPHFYDPIESMAYHYVIVARKK